MTPPLPSALLLHFPRPAPFVLAVLLGLVVLIGPGPRRAAAAEYNFAGSVSLNYKTLLNELRDDPDKNPPDSPNRMHNLLLSGFNINASVKAVVDISPYLSATVKVCYGCHGFEALNFFAELTPHPAFNIRAGRIMPSFGDFYLRHDPTSHKTPDNPLPYDMGHMVHLREWGMSVLPIPYVDSGAEAYGTLRPAEWLSISYAAHVVNGFKGSASASPTGAPAHDFAFQRMRFVTSPDYLTDNNRWPSVGGRLALTFARTGSMSPSVPDMTVGASAMYGLYDDYEKLSYLIYGLDFYLRVWRLNLRAEFIRRQQDADARLLDFPDGRKTLGLGATDSVPAQIIKEGFYAEADFPMWSYFEGVLRLDGMRRSGPREAQKNPDDPNYQPPPAAALDFEDWILRYTVGLNIIPLTGAKIELAYEYWTFKNVPDNTLRNSPPPTSTRAKFQDEYMLHVALAASF